MKNRGKNIGLLLTGMAAGAALCGGAYAAGIVAQPTWQPIFVDGQQVEMEAYNINGNNVCQAPGHRKGGGLQRLLAERSSGR